MAKRLQGMGQATYVNGFQRTLQPHTLEPKDIRQPFSRNCFRFLMQKDSFCE